MKHLQLRLQLHTKPQRLYQAGSKALCAGLAVESSVLTQLLHWESSKHSTVAKPGCVLTPSLPVCLPGCCGSHCGWTPGCLCSQCLSGRCTSRCYCGEGKGSVQDTAGGSGQYMQHGPYIWRAQEKLH
jgi:hypothetical protein